MSSMRSGSGHPRARIIQSTEQCVERAIWHVAWTAAEGSRPLEELSITNIVNPPRSVPLWEATMRFVKDVEDARLAWGAPATSRDTAGRRIDLEYL